MRALQTIAIAVSMGLVSCNNDRAEIIASGNNGKFNSAPMDKGINPNSQLNIGSSDTIKKFIVDDYPVTDGMLGDRRIDNPSYDRQSGDVYSSDKVWFSNDSLKQILVFELYTDYYRAVSFHFFSNDIPADLISRMTLHFDKGDIASDKQKLNDFSGFLEQTTKIQSRYFTTNKGIKLGDAKQKAVDIYGKPDSQLMNNGIERVEWQFVGDINHDYSISLMDKPLAKNSFGHQIVMYFRNEKLIAQILENNVP